MTVTSNLKPGIAARRIASFEKRFGQAHLVLAYHAALPLVLTSDLLYSLWINFRQDIRGQALNIPWFAVADLLLSSLCNEVGYELYQMDATVRNELLNRLRQDDCFGQTRIEELSNFLLDHIRQQLQSDESYVQNFAKAQRWAALAYTRPHKTTYELALAFSQLNFDNPAEILRMLSLLENLALPLPEFQSLLTYARGIAAFVRGNIEVATTHLKELVGVDNQIRIAGVRLPTPAPVQSRLNALRSESTLRRANLRGQSYEGQDLTGVDFSYSDIRGTDFTDAILVGANFAHTTAGLQSYREMWLIFCSMLLSLSSGIGAIIMGYYLQTFLITPINEATYIFAISVLLLFAVICVVIFRQGIEATLGAVTLAVTGNLAFGAVIGLPTIWDWVTKTILAIAGIIALVIGGSSARLGVLSFLGKWATRLTIAVGVIYGFYAWLIIGGGNNSARGISGVADAKFKAWLESVFNYNYDLKNYIITAIVVAIVGSVGLILVEAVGMALALIVSRALALTVGLCWIPIWFLFLILSQAEPKLAGSMLILTSIAGLGVYIGWQAINRNEKYAFVVNAAVAATSFWMKGTNFRGANLTDANFSDAKLKGVDFSNANLTRTSWFHTKELELAHVGESYLKSPQIRQLVITGLGQGKNFDDLSLRGLNLSGVNLADASFIGTDLSQANLQDANLSGAKLVKTQLEQTDFTGACLTGAYIQDCNITSSTKFDGVECDYIYTRLVTPDNPNPCRQPEDYGEIFEPGEFADIV
ncbi:pentapeptide repeat-containing protein [Scytonema sp. PCC 10023]|uniref:pentapeptide repeat-containing protein n=1 Tax=Scytonema sp. PCC 10023 TaxID=1680591 RepID=UPI0039C6DF1B